MLYGTSSANLIRVIHTSMISQSATTTTKDFTKSTIETLLEFSVTPIMIITGVGFYAVSMMLPKVIMWALCRLPK